MDLGGVLRSWTGCGAGVARLEDGRMIEQHYSPAQLAGLLGVSLMTISRRVAAGELEVVRFGGRVLIPESSVQRVLDKCREPVRPLPVRRGVRPLIASL
jgi:excisionase family DNA binding protein